MYDRTSEGRAVVGSHSGEMTPASIEVCKWALAGLQYESNRRLWI